MRPVNSSTITTLPAYQIVDVAREQPVRAQRLIDVVDQGDVRDVVQLRVLQQLRLGQPLLHLLGAASTSDTARCFSSFS